MGPILNIFSPRSGELQTAPKYQYRCQWDMLPEFCQIVKDVITNCVANSCVQTCKYEWNRSQHAGSC